MPVLPLGDRIPKIHPSAFIAPDAWIIGDVEIGEDVSVFFGAVLRGDIQPIRVGARTNIQEHALLHSSHDLPPCLVGAGVTVGHRAIVHGCSVGDNTIVGMGSTLLDAAVIGRDSIVGAHSLIAMRKSFPDGSMILGVPAKVTRPLTPEEIEGNRRSAAGYVAGGRRYRELLGS